MQEKESSKKRPTIDDVARRAGVSIATVSRVLNGAGVVRAATADRVRAAVSDLNYAPHAAAQQLAGGHKHALGLILPAVSSPFFAELLRGIEASTQDAGYALLLFVAAGPLTTPLPLNEHNTDGLLVFAHSLGDDELRRLHARGCPLVLLHQTPPADLPLPSVTFMNKEGARQIVDHLITVHHCRRIAFLAGPAGNEDSYWRQEGYRAALAAHDIPFDPTLLAQGDFDATTAAQTVADWLATGVRPDAIFSADDSSALGARSALRQASLAVPADIKLVGFDDTVIARHMAPALTTVAAPIAVAGAEAARQLIRLARGEAAATLTLLPTKLIIRQSCGCPATPFEEQT